jgi:hypothetical protein
MAYVSFLPNSLSGKEVSDYYNLGSILLANLHRCLREEILGFFFSGFVVGKRVFFSSTFMLRNSSNNKMKSHKFCRTSRM